MAHTNDPDDDLDGCELDFAVEAIPEDELDYVVLFGDTPEGEVAAKAAAYAELFNAS